MPSISTQSIGVVGAPLANTSQAAQLSRASQAGVQAGIQHNHTAVQALHSATQVKKGPQRPIQEERRAEGVFEEGSDEQDSESSEAGPEKKSAPRLNTVA